MVEWQIDDPAEVNTKRINDYVGEVLIIIMGGFHPVWITEFSKQAARVAAVVLSGPDAGTVLEDQLLFGQQSKYVEHLRPGAVCAVRIALDGKAIKLLPTGDYDKGMVRAWLSHNEDFALNLARETITAFDLARNDDRTKGVAPAKAVNASPQFTPPAVAAQSAAPPVQVGQSDDPMVRDQPSLPLDAEYASDEPAF